MTFDRKLYYSTLYMELYKQNVDPRTLEVWSELDKDLDTGYVTLIVYAKLCYGGEQYYTAYRILPEENSNSKWMSMAAKRSAYLFRDHIFPSKIDQLAFFEKKLNEFHDEASA